MTALTRSATWRRASARATPAISRRSYGVSTWRTEVTTARVGDGLGVGVGPAPGRAAPTRPLRRAPAWPAICLARSGGHPGNSWPNSGRQGGLELDVMLGAGHLLSQAAALAGVLVSQALLLGIRQCRLLYQHALALVAAP